MHEVTKLFVLHEVVLSPLTGHLLTHTLDCFMTLEVRLRVQQ